MTVTDRILELAQEGQLHGLTLFASKTRGWQAAARKAGSSEGYSVSHATDPVQAISDVLDITFGGGQPKNEGSVFE